jgi:hypothetical protein
MQACQVLAPSSRTIDALVLLRSEHDAIKRHFRDYELGARRGAHPDLKAELAGRLCFRLCSHFQIEEELFYPGLGEAVAHTTWLSHCLCDQAGSRELIALLDATEPADDAYDATVAVLAAFVIPHIHGEEWIIFPMVRLLALHTAALGRHMAQRQSELNARPRQLFSPDDVRHPADSAAPSVLRLSPRRSAPP